MWQEGEQPDQVFAVLYVLVLWQGKLPSFHAHKSEANGTTKRLSDQGLDRGGPQSPLQTPHASRFADYVPSGLGSIR